MDQKKIGIFIAELRKKKNMTQKDLAEKLNVSITAVSKWERGICLMDMSLLKPLSQILEVSIAEIINGEKDNNNIEDAIENTLKYSSKKIEIEKRKKYIILLTAIIILFFIGLYCYKGLLVYSINSIEKNIYEMKDNSKKEFGAPIYINNIVTNEYYTFKNMKLKNIFKDKIKNTEDIDNVSYTLDTDKHVVLITENTSNLLNSYLIEFPNDIIDREKHFNKLNINNDLELHKYISDFTTKDFSIFNSLSFLQQYYFECSFYNIIDYSFDEVHEIRGDLNGYVVILKDKYISYHIINGDVEYGISFVGNFDYNYTLDIISTIKFN